MRASLVLALGAALVACGSSSSSPTKPSDGCATPTLPTGVTSARIVVGGTSRSYTLSVPDGDLHQPRPVIFVFHGSGGSGADIRGYMGARWDKKGLEDLGGAAAIYVYPDGIGQVWPNTDGRDVALFDALLADLQSRGCVDSARVFATGFSYGGYMSNTLACSRAGVVRAIAPLSGGGPSGPCNGEPVAAMVVSGSADTTVAPSQCSGSRDHWLGVDKCAGTSHAVAPAGCSAYDGCGANPVIWCSFNGGHEVQDWEPGAVWSFFKGF